MLLITDQPQRAAAAAVARVDSPTPELSIVIPCLNEAETIGVCVEKAKRALSENGINGEVVVADNGSVDGSPEIARRKGARVAPAAERGYGNALFAGVGAAHGRFIIMGDADDSYDFLSIQPFVDKLRGGADLVMGDRFRGGIDPGAMPWKHRWIGNPVLSFIGRTLFNCQVRDFHCGLRGFTREAFDRMDLQTTGMEFASEMVIKGALLRMTIAEVPTPLHKDGRSHPPHLRSWRDGWRHLRFMLLFSPRWLFMVPGLALLAVGTALSLWLCGGPRRVGPLTLDVHSLLVAGLLVLLGFQVVVFGLFTKMFAVVEKLHPAATSLRRVPRIACLETGIALGAGVALAGAFLLGAAVWKWKSTGFGDLDPRLTMRRVIPAVVLIVLGVQTIFASFFLSVLTLRRRPRAV